MGNHNKKLSNKNPLDIKMLNKAIFGGGCFWCTETLFAKLRGVQRVQSGYAGGNVKNPTYKQVCEGATGHAQVIRIHYNPNIISYRTLLYIFFHIHDPTTLNRQGHDIGSQYRSTVMYQTEEEKNDAYGVIEEVMKEGKYPGAPNKIVTEVVKADVFYSAEDYHQNYFNLNPNQGYCMAVIQPKVSKFRKLFKEYLDNEKL